MSLFRSEISKNLTQVDPDLSSKIRRTHPGMAHFAGTGPHLATCGKCRFYGLNARAKKQACMKYSAMMNGMVGPSFPASTAACKYYEVKND